MLGVLDGRTQARTKTDQRDGIVMLPNATDVHSCKYRPLHALDLNPRSLGRTDEVVAEIVQCSKPILQQLTAIERCEKFAAAEHPVQKRMLVSSSCIPMVFAFHELLPSH